jgi:four helix bundle protein
LHKRILRERTVPHRLLNQVLNSGTSIGANLEEAKSAQSFKDLRSKYAIALKEARETRYWLRVLSETQLVSEGHVAWLLAELGEMIAILTACIRRIHDRPSPPP